MSEYKYVIKVDDKIIWEGQYPKEKLKETIEKNKGKEISVAWVDLSGDVLIAKL